MSHSNRSLLLTYTIVLIGVVFALTFAQDKKIDSTSVPTPILKAFQETYPNAKAKGFSTEYEKGQTYYEVESVDGKVNRDLLYKADGKLVEIEESIEESQLPTKVSSALKREFPAGRIAKAEKTTRGQDVGFEFIVVEKAKTYELGMTSDGKITGKKLLNKKQEKKDDEQNEKSEDD